MSPHDPRRYLAVFAGTAFLLLVAVSGVNWLGFVNGYVDLPEARLLHRQLAKLEAAPRVDVLLLGDSSLANAVDAETWSRASGRSVLALPLAGYLGYEGTLNMLRRALRRADRPELVVVMQTIELAAREPTPQGTLVTAQTWADLEGVRPWHVLSYFSSVPMAGGVLANLFVRGRNRPGELQAGGGGFVRQKAKPDPAEVVEEQEFLHPDDLNGAKLAVLARIADTCRAAGVRCVYAHGPYVEPACSAAGPFLAELDRRVRAMGLEVLERTPVCFKLAQAGDQPDHVGRSALPLFSEVYRRLVLGPDGTGPQPSSLRS